MEREKMSLKVGIKIFWKGSRTQITWQCQGDSESYWPWRQAVDDSMVNWSCSVSEQRWLLQSLCIRVSPEMEIICNPQLKRQDDYQHQHFHMKYETNVYNLAFTYFCTNCLFLVLSKRQVIFLLIQEARKHNHCWFFFKT